MIAVRRALRLAVTAVLMFAVGVQPAMAQSILRDAETEAFLRDLSTPLATAAGLNPRSVQVMLIGDPSLNAFVTGGQNVFFHSGTLMQADDVSQIQGIMAHELGHITGGHNVRFADEGGKAATGISLLSLLIGAAAIAAGAGEAGAGILAAGQQAALGKFLAYSRNQESAADLAGAQFLDKAGISGRGSIAFFKKLENQEFRYGYNRADPYMQTHPMSSDRIQTLTEVYQRSAHWDTPVDPVLNARFNRIKGKLIGFSEEPSRTFQLYPETDQSVAARYARAYAYHKQAFHEKAVAEVDKLLAADPADPFFLELKGQVLLESGKVAEAIPPLRLAVRRAPDQPLIASLLGHALISTEDPSNLKEATEILRAAVARDNSNPFAWYQLGIAYERQGDEARAALATAERFSLSGDDMRALPNARRAMAGLATGTPDWIRAQDIAMASQGELERMKKRRR